MEFNENIYVKTKKIIYNYLNNQFYNYTEDDISDIILKIYNKYNTYDNNIGSYSNWVICITKNHMLDCVKKLNKVDYYDTLHEFDFNDNVIEITYDHDIIYDRISSTISEYELSIFDLKYMKGYKNKEIADMFNITSSTVSNKINYIKTKIKNKGTKSLI
jgi:RNA polymerase sigma factor (sigma-70 family)